MDPDSDRPPTRYLERLEVMRAGAHGRSMESEILYGIELTHGSDLASS